MVNRKCLVSENHLSYCDARKVYDDDKDNNENDNNNNNIDYNDDDNNNNNASSLTFRTAV